MRFSFFDQWEDLNILFAKAKVTDPHFMISWSVCEEFLKRPPYLDQTHVWVAEKERKKKNCVLIFFPTLLLHKFH